MLETLYTVPSWNATKKFDFPVKAKPSEHSEEPTVIEAELISGQPELQEEIAGNIEPKEESSETVEPETEQETSEAIVPESQENPEQTMQEQAESSEPSEAEQDKIYMPKEAKDNVAFIKESIVQANKEVESCIKDISNQKIRDPEILSSLKDQLRRIKTTFVQEYDEVEQLVENTGSPVLEKGVEQYLKLCIYSVFKLLYESNPHNTGKMFASDGRSTADHVSRLSADMPQLIQSLVSSCRISTDRFELPVERGHELRLFIKECEQLLGTQ